MKKRNRKWVKTEWEIVIITAEDNGALKQTLVYIDSHIRREREKR